MPMGLLRMMLPLDTGALTAMPLRRPSIQLPSTIVRFVPSMMLTPWPLSFVSQPGKQWPLANALV